MEPGFSTSTVFTNKHNHNLVYALNLRQLDMLGVLVDLPMENKSFAVSLTIPDLTTSTVLITY